MPRNYAPEHRLGKTFHRLTILEVWGVNKRGEWCYVCHCACGDFCIASGSAMELERRKSCGCLSQGGLGHKPPKYKKDRKPPKLEKRIKQQHQGLELFKAW